MSMCFAMALVRLFYSFLIRSQRYMHQKPTENVAFRYLHTNGGVAEMKTWFWPFFSLYYFHSK